MFNADFITYVVVVCIPFMTFLFLFSLYQKKYAPPRPILPNRPPQNHQKVWQKRTSQLDASELLEVEEKSPVMQSEYRGLINLCFIGLLFFVTSHQVRHFLKEGTIWGAWTFMEMFTHTGVVATWAVLCLIALLAFPIQKLITFFQLGRIVQFTLHASLIAALFTWTITLIWTNPSWPFIPKGSLCAQLMVLVMKIHSYLANNKEFANQAKNPKKDEKKNGTPTVTPALQYPHNVTARNFFEFLMFPTLVYELEYPRTEKIRLGYVLEKLVMTVGVMSCLHLVSQFYIYPALMRSPHESAIEVIAELIMPFFAQIWLIFYLVFDCICNGFAEVTRFADRQFYTDWWNSTTMDEFARSWNRPVHEWLLKHIYLESIENFKVSKFRATVATFLFSSILHEFVLVLCFRLFTPFLFMSQMAQIPLIMLGRDLKGTRIGNCFFWVGILLGVPLISVLYCREYFKEKHQESLA